MTELFLTGRKTWGRLSVRAGSYAVVALASPFLAQLIAPLVPSSLAGWADGGGLEKVLETIASNMLTIVTFSLSTLVATLALVVSSAPPRATALLVRDTRAHRALATFLGAFIFSVAAVFALAHHAYDPKSRFILLAMTLFVLLSIIWTIVRWIGHLSGMGQLNNVIDRVEKVAEGVNLKNAFLFSETPPARNTSANISFVSKQTGFVQRINYSALNRLAGREELKLWIDVTPGLFVQPRTVLFSLSSAIGNMDFEAEALECFVIGDRRTFDDDPRFGFIVLAEIGSRALSPGINDPGTAIQILASLFRLFNAFPDVKDHGFPHLRIRPIALAEVMDDAFRTVARDGAGMLEVQVFLQKGLYELALIPRFRAGALEISARSLSRARANISDSIDMDRVERSANQAENISLFSKPKN